MPPPSSSSSHQQSHSHSLHPQQSGMDKNNTPATVAATTPAPQKKKRKRAGSGESVIAAGQGRGPAKSPRPEIVEGSGVANAGSVEGVGGDKGEAEKSSDRSHGSTPSINHVPTVARQGSAPQQSQTSTPSSQQPQAKDPETVRQSVEAQLSLEVLLKHDELRLIDQEIAKCQIALEQLRRCSEIPYPGSDAAGVLDSASVGTGRAVLPPGNGRPPLSPSPWGVRDGPYGRHYAKWLIPDPRFDGGSVAPSGANNAATSVATAAGKAPTDGRATRGSVGDAGSTGATKRPQRGSTGSGLQSLSNGYPPPKDKTGPTIIKRKTDGHLVKLVCLDCRRDNFFSTQGFINHCRIAHNRNFASHDAAAIASGEEVEVDEAGMVIGENKDPGVVPGYIHPLIRSAHLVDTPQKASASRRKSSKRSSQAGSGQSSTPSDAQSESKAPIARKESSVDATPKAVNSPLPNSAFKASPETPHLSALMQRRGIGLDLLGIVGDAKTKSELDMLDSPTAGEDESSDDEKKNALANADVRGSRLPARTVASSAPMQRPNSRKGLDNSARKPRHLETLAPSGPPKAYNNTPSYPPTSAPPQPPDTITDITSANLSPNTIESNQAPSLVSDDGDYEMPSDSEGPSPSSEDEEGDDRRFDNVEVEDDEERRGGGGPAAAEAKGGGGKSDLVTRRSGVPLRYPGRR
ncbi:hypothetical protein FQN54_002094 [Arachnomyces sp. PD_36]|nr:hypothetical protein FQN54_002094 [Arachnomyces sp. PD_36]